MKMNRIVKCSMTALSAATLAFPGSGAAGQAGTSPLEKDYTGMVASVNDQEHTLTVRRLLFHKMFRLGDPCAITRWDQTVGTIHDLHPGQKVRVNYRNAQGVLAADRVEQQAMRHTGMVQAIDPAGRKLALHTGWRGDITLILPEDCQVVLHDQERGALASIKPGDCVTVVYESPGGLELARQIDQTSASFTGSITAIDLSARTLSAKDMLGTKQFSLAGDCAIVMGGKTDAPLVSLRPGERLAINYNEVNGVNVANRLAPAEPARETTTAQTGP